MIKRRYGIFKSYRGKRRCTYNEMYNGTLSIVEIIMLNLLLINFTVLIGRRWIIVIH